MLHREFEVLIIKIPTGLKNRVEDISETFNDKVKKEPQMKNTIKEIKICMMEEIIYWTKQKNE